MKNKDWERVLKALANKRRLAILKLLYPGKAMTVGFLAREIDLSFRSTSKHLMRLFNVGILEREGRKGETFYFINPKIDQGIVRIFKTLFF